MTGEDLTQRLPKLPDLQHIPVDLYRGPTPYCNHVILGRVLAGAYPAMMGDQETMDMLKALLGFGINTFVCLQAEFNLGVSEMSWKLGKTLRPYIKDAQRLLMEAKAARKNGATTSSDLLDIEQTKLDLLHLPIVDGGVTSDRALSNLADDCCQRILNGERLYIHCWGGHGRTGTLVAVILARLYGLSALEALKYTQALHDTRISHQSTASPQTQVQIIQVLRILAQDEPQMYRLRYRWPLDALLPLDARQERQLRQQSKFNAVVQHDDEEENDTIGAINCNGKLGMQVTSAGKSPPLKKPREINIIADATSTMRDYVGK